MQQGLALLQLSRYEPFGLTVAEALAAGVPAIVTAAVGSAEEVDPSVAFLVPIGQGEVAEVVAVLERLRVLHESEREALAVKCRSEAERLFSPAVVADQLERAIRELLA
jgi:glycosyltransferase involved in cell wall biosynthesis